MRLPSVRSSASIEVNVKASQLSRPLGREVRE
jgi:hypothetical protein